MHLQTLWLAFELMLQWVGVCVFGGQNVEGELHHKQVPASTVFAQVHRDFQLLKILNCETLQSLQA
jgi:hypothetical protein